MSNDERGDRRPYRPLDYLDHGLLSPSGRCSKRSRKFLQDQLARQLWPNGCTREDIQGSDPGPSEEERLAGERERLVTQIKRLRELADRGMSRAKFSKEANRLQDVVDSLVDRE